MSSQTPNPAMKRRRVDEANATLRKPFRLPLINRPNKAGTAGEAGSPLSRVESLSTLDSAKPAADEVSGAAQSPSSPERVHKAAEAAQPASKVRSSLSGGRNEFVDLILQRKREVDRESRELARELDIIDQAEAIKKASLSKRPGEEIDVELKELIEKWRAASRLAADELFELIKDRVASMGGAKAWREAQKRQMDFYRGLDDEQRPQTGSGADGHDCEADETDTTREEFQGSQGGGGEDTDDLTAGEEEEFTMSMMFRSLNIDPDLLGYNVADGSWKD